MPGAAGGASHEGVVGLNRGMLGLAGANALALLAGAAASVAYARWLDAPAFAHWAMALSAGRCALLLIDGGLKTVLVRQGADIHPHTGRRLMRWCAAAACGLALALAIALGSAWAAGWLAGDAALLLAVYPAAYLLSYPPLLPALARLERAGRFASLGRIEGLTALLELALPALLMAAGLAWWLSFCAAVLLARGWRTWQTMAVDRALASAGDGQRDGHGDGPRPAGSAPGEAARLLREGMAQQAVHGLAMLRDLSHLWLLAPLFGQAWAGQYAFAHAAAGLVCQPLVLAAARMLLPQLRTLSPSQRRVRVLRQTGSLCLLSLPLMAVLPLLLAASDDWLGAGKWEHARALLPWLALRLVGGIVSTLMGTWLCVQAAPWAAARAHGRWTGVECLGAAAGLALWGPMGLAMASAVTVWFAAFDFSRLLAAPGERPALLRDAVAAAVCRPALAVAAAGFAWWQWQAPSAAWLPLLPLLPLLAWLSERRVRALLLDAGAHWLRPWMSRRERAAQGATERAAR